VTLQRTSLRRLSLALTLLALLGHGDGAGAPRAPGLPAIDVRRFGALCDGVHSDAPAINRAIRAAEVSGAREVHLPPGTCYVKQEPGQGILDVPIRPEVDGLTLSGATDGTSRILLDADSPAILVNKGDTSPPEEVKNLTIRDLTVEAIHGKGLSNAGVVQLNHATRLHVADLLIKGDGRAQHDRGIKMSGLATSQGTTGLLERVVVDGGSKAGIYVASGTHHLTVKDCETAHMWNTAPVNAPPPGISVSDAHRIRIIGHRSHHNGGDGLFIATNGLAPVRLPGLPEDAYGSYYPLQQEHGPATTVEVSGGLFADNGDAGGSGIVVASMFAEVPRDIQIHGATVKGNKRSGVLVEAGDSIVLQDLTASDNGVHGVLVREVVLAGQPPEASRTSGVQVKGPQVFDNGRAVSVDIGGIEVWGRARGVSVLGGVIGKSDPSSRQNLGIGLVEEGGRSCVDLLVRGTELAREPMPYGWRTSRDLWKPVVVPPGRPFDCDDR
jgi:hypothetical protein